MLPLERQNKILEILADRQAVSVEELCHTLYSSGATIRRDLAILENNGLLRRTHGGAVFIDGSARDFPLTLRENENLVPKITIAQRALPYIRDGLPCSWTRAARSAGWPNGSPASKIFG